MKITNTHSSPRQEFLTPTFSIEKLKETCCLGKKDSLYIAYFKKRVKPAYLNFCSVLLMPISAIM